jgi:DNA-binding beta-propeller fold protein YncE
MSRFLKKMNIACLMFSCLAMLLFHSCKEEAANDKNEFDPDKPVEITDFTPKSGSARTRMHIYGKNFGTDIARISVKIGDVPAKVIGSNGEIIYCLVPHRAVNGTVEVAIGADSVRAIASGVFDYQSKTVVSTLAGYIDPTGKKEVKDGPFDDCGFEGPRWMSVDPKNKNHIYMIDASGTTGISIRLLDIEANSVSTLINRGQGNWSNLRQIEFSLTGDTLLIANEQNVDNGIAVSCVTRGNLFQRPQHIAYYRQNSTCAVHPMYGELYYNSRTTGELVRYDWQTKEAKVLYTVKSRDCQYFIFFHPDGNYAYMTVPNKKVILKAEYDWENKTLKVANNFAGNDGQEGWQDGQGTNARLGNPMQGCFVKNEKYVREGKTDVYDFYFADQNAHCIRYLTPEGFVYTYAGRGSQGVNSNAYGYVDGDLLKEARFNQPVGIVYDEENKTFYIGDANNSRIRTIIIDE